MQPNAQVYTSREFNGPAALAKYRGAGRVILDPANPVNDVARCVKNWADIEKNCRATSFALEHPESFRLSDLQTQLHDMQATLTSAIADSENRIMQKVSDMDKV